MTEPLKAPKKGPKRSVQLTVVEGQGLPRDLACSPSYTVYSPTDTNRLPIFESGPGRGRRGGDGKRQRRNRGGGGR